MKNKKIVKAFLLFITVFLMLLTLSFSVNAKSGCCSGHGGVKCSAGPDSDGSVICNDGTRDSSCLYSEMEKCKISPNDDSSSHNNSNNTSNNTNNTSSNTNNNTNNNITRTSKNTSLLEKILTVLIFSCFFCPVIPVVVIRKLLDLFSSKKSKSSQNVTNKKRTKYKKPYSYQGNMTCPRCGGRLIKKNGKYGYFYGCENYKTNGCKYTRNI